MNSHDEFNPASLISAACSGDANAVAALLERYRPYLRLLARVLLHRHLQSKVDESDVVQEAALLVSRDITHFSGHSEQEFAAWLRKVLINVISNTHRHYYRGRRDVRFELQLNSDLEQSSAGLAQLAGAESSPSHRTMRREQAVMLAEALERLPDDYRQVLLLREIDGLSLAQIAERMNRSRNSVQKLWARAIAQMRLVLKDLT